GVSGTAGKDPKVLTRGRSKQYVRRLDLLRRTVRPVRPLGRGRRSRPKSPLGGKDNSDSTCRKSRRLARWASGPAPTSIPPPLATAARRRIDRSQTAQPETRHVTAHARPDKGGTSARRDDPDPRPRWFLYVTDRVARRAGHRARGEDPEGP